MAVEWRVIPGWENYEANSYGFVRNATTRRRLRPFDTGDVLRVTLYSKGKPKASNVGAWILTAFVGPRPGPQWDCSHQDGNYQNNRLSNLAWETRRRNMERRDEHGTTARGESHGMAKLTEREVREILSLMAQKPAPTHLALAQRYGVSWPLISAIHSGRIWRKVPRPWGYVGPSPHVRRGAQRLGRDSVAAIKEALRQGIPGTELAQAYEVSQSTISRIGRGVTWREVP